MKTTMEEPDMPLPENLTILDFKLKNCTEEKKQRLVLPMNQCLYFN